MLLKIHVNGNNKVTVKKISGKHIYLIVNQHIIQNTIYWVLSSNSIPIKLELLIRLTERYNYVRG